MVAHAGEILICADGMTVKVVSTRIRRTCGDKGSGGGGTGVG